MYHSRNLFLLRRLWRYRTSLICLNADTLRSCIDQKRFSLQLPEYPERDVYRGWYEGDTVHWQPYNFFRNSCGNFKKEVSEAEQGMGEKP